MSGLTRTVTCGDRRTRYWVGVATAVALLGGHTRALSEEPSAPTRAFVEAQTAEARKDYVQAATLYDQAVREEPENIAALVGRARMRSWLKQFPQAIADYRAVLERDQNNPQALSGLGWTYAWNRDYDDAVAVFDYLKRIEPYYLDAQKGLAYVQLWRGDARGARRSFEALATEDRGNPDYTLAIAQAAFLEGDLEAARAAYDETLRLEPGMQAAREGLEAVKRATIERRPALMVLYGRSESGDADKTGIRMVQLSKQFTAKFRGWITHDRGIGFDGFSPDRRAQDSATTTVGAFINYRPRLAARIEAGIRDLVDETQPVFSAEQVFFLPGGLTPKLGVWVADGDEATQWVVNAGAHRWLGSRFAIEPTLYFGDDGASREIRGALLGTYTTSGRVQFGLGFALGSKDEDAGGNRSVDRIFGHASVPLGMRATFLFYGWREATEGFDDQVVLAVGFTAFL
jgi:tetratricopeptide (TPR) repeat protein